MLVSLAVLVLALSVVSVVFTTTTRTAGQAAAYSETLNRVRQYTLQIEEDLKYCVPSQSIMVAGGREVPAALTQADLEAGRFYRVLVGNSADPTLAGYDAAYAPTIDANGNYSDPRADMLMFISNRPSVSQAPPVNPTDPFQIAAAGGVKLAPVIVTYGHAALGQAVWDGTTYLFPQDPALQHIEQMKTSGGSSLSVIPANRWHLGRRATILQPTNFVPPALPKVRFLTGGWGDEWTRITRGEPETNRAGDTAALDVSAFLAGFGPLPAPVTSAALKDPYGDWPVWSTIQPGTWPVSLDVSLKSLLYYQGNPANHHVATVLDEVPLELRGNLGVQMLPGCAWFQVEFLMPEDPRNSVAYTANPQTTGMSPRSDMPRWTNVGPGQTYVFVPDTPENRDLVAQQVTRSVSADRLWTFGRLDQNAANQQNAVDALPQRIIRMWPYAIRVTVRVYDRQGRLPEPIVRSVVHRFE